MKKRFLPFSLLLVIMILGQSVIADQGGHYVPRTQPTMNAESYMGSLRANQNTGLIDPADMFKAMQAPATKDAANDPLYWISMGPDNMGGQTTAIVYDNQSNVVYIGSKGGGVYKTYNFGVTWHQVGNLDLMVSTMVQDENGIIYVGTGDGGVNIDHNGLTDLNYSNSFIGTGIYTIDVRNNDLMTQVVAPTAD
jgi:ligand-binding sensor domain-containing protein